MLQIKKTKRKEKQNRLQKWQTAFVLHEKLYNLQMKHQQKHYTDHNLVFCKHKKNKLISHHKVKNHDVKTSKKRNKEILFREK